MDAATAAAVAALVVSVLAMTIATAQVLQQYLNTGQLIRMCDSVVYGKMPGRGRRIWEYSQFRFRVVYSVPQISLRPSLWEDSLAHYVSYERGLLPLPDLHRDALDTHPSLFQRSAKGRGSAQSAETGEACWVSFCRVAQNSCTDDLFYELLHRDADRCPSDLPVVPMQVSMRDIVIIALMAGMRCTDASFEGKSIAMDGEAGAITSSWHPMLGSIIHFSPRNSHRPLGIRLRGGKIDPAWMARTWDVVTVAGRKYDARDRKTFEAYEGNSWVASSRGRSMAKASDANYFYSLSPVRSFRLRSTSPTQTLRRRRTRSVVGGPLLVRPRSNPTTVHAPSILDLSNSDDRANGRHATPDDRKLHVRTPESKRGTSPPLTLGNRALDVSANQALQQQKSIAPSRGWRQPLRYFLDKWRGVSSQNSVKEQSDAYITDVEGHGTIEVSSADRDLRDMNQSSVQTPDIAGAERRSPRPLHTNRGWNLPASGPRKALDGRSLQQYIIEKQQAAQPRSRGHNNLLTWKPFPEEREEDNVSVNEDWHTSIQQLRRERSYSMIDKWRTTLSSRQHMRHERDAQTEWEIETYYSTSRQSSATASEQRRRVSPSEARSISRESRASRRSRRGPTTDSVIKRLRSAEREIVDSGKSVDENALPDEHEVAYGRDPILVGSSTEATREPQQSTKTPQEEGRLSAGELDNLQLLLDSSQRKKVHYSSPTEALPTNSEAERSPSIPATAKPSRFEVDQPLSSDAGLANSGMPSEKLLHNVIPVVEPRRGILRRPREQFPEDPNPLREGVAPLREARALGIPPGARWTKISRRLVNLEALEQARERFEDRGDYVIVLRVLTKEEIQILADKTQAIREAREFESLYPEQVANPGARQASSRGLPRNRASRARNRFSGSLDGTRPVESGSDATDLVDPGAGSAESNTSWSGQSVYGSGESSKISHSPDTMSESEELDLGRPELPVRPELDNMVNSILSDKSKAATYSDRSPSPRQVLVEHLRGRLKTNQGSVRRRASTRSNSSSFSSRSSGSDSERLKPLDTRDILSASYSDPVPDIPKHDRSAVDDVTTGKGTLKDGSIKWLWICQADVLPGYFANPWHDLFSSDTCLGAIVTMLEVLEYYTDNSTLTYVDALPWCEQWLYEGKSTHPSYAINAMGGTIVPTDYHFLNFENYNTPMPAIQLLHSYHHQINPSGYQGTNTSVIERLTELMALDSWLSFCGRQPEIYDGRNNLLQSLPMLIQKMMSDFDYEFSSLDRTSTDGGHQIVKELAALIAHTLEKEMLSEEEQLFTTVAMLRAAKMALCLLNGPATLKLRDIFMKDVHVYLV
ncbi:uncharacterized protein A1O9_10557 [Exophiala aquamarina CBS 119918]|uniref:DUF8035 domain-containing protein n=1 Tax=Exophiala aquamarina CBS 119918 TaxID=1182545 RepID=A0A072P1M1_9EURO|nr:uncharacterized protein A1O9_10557 [Exophiala aquamarina CBS 119918]KEF53582.1 hypothetical protein A1O9_10557 [Exophiala aquamarina CBS 119918]